MSQPFSLALQRIEEQQAKLAKNRGDVIFTVDRWRFWLDDLRTSPLVGDQPKRLLFYLAAFCRPSTEPPKFNFPGFTALHESLANLSEVRAYVAKWDTPSNQEVVEFNQDLDLPAYLAHEEMAEDLADAIGYKGSQAAVRPKLQLVFQLMEASPAYGMVEKLETMGLAAANREPLVRFVQERRRARDDVARTEVVNQTMSNMETNRILQTQFSKVLEKMKLQDFTGFQTEAKKLDDQQRGVFIMRQKSLQVRAELAGEKDKPGVMRQLRTLEAMEAIRQSIFKALQFFAEKELFEGLKLVNWVVPIFTQMLQVCDNSVALIYIGLIKTGKSTIVDTIIGENVSPSRTAPMTAIPVRYVHDPNAKEPVMLVPFYSDLNRVVRAVKTIVATRGKEAILQQLFGVHLKALLEKIDSGGLEFRPQYSGSKDVLEASIDLHDLFRLAVQTTFPATLAAELPLDWSRGLDSFLTVSIKFPDAFGVSSAVKLSVIDTPGVNEAGVERLNLGQVIVNAVDVCHYVAFTVQAQSYQSKDNTKLRRLISRISSSTRTPTLVLATNLDTLSSSAESQEETRINIAYSLNDVNEYPRESVYFVSGKRKLVGGKMLDYLEKFGTKPSVTDQGGRNEDEETRKMTRDFALFACQGDDEDDRLDAYSGLTLDALKTRCQKLITSSQMKTPMDKMIKTATGSASILSCNKAVEKTKEGSQEIKAYLQRLLDLTTADAVQVDDLAAKCRDVHSNIVQGSTEIRANLVKQMQEFRDDLQRDLQKVQAEFFQDGLSEAISKEDSWQFKTKADAENRVRKAMEEAEKAFSERVDRSLDNKRAELEETANKIQLEVQEKILKQLTRIVIDSEPEAVMQINIPKPDINLSTTGLGFADALVTQQEKLTSMKSKLLSLAHFRVPDMKQDVFVVNVDKIWEAACEAIAEYTASMVRNATNHVDDYVSKYVDALFLLALSRVNLARESLARREVLRDTTAQIEGLLSPLTSQMAELASMVGDP